jgi:AcrR family transcriptional regulator
VSRKPSSASKRPPKARPVRVRRTAEEARERILDAAEARLRRGGPEAIRLQEIAADAGISHPTILHHFESRDGLTRELAKRIGRKLGDDILEAIARSPATEASAVEMIEHVFATLRDTGTARLLAWRELSYESADGGAETRKLLDGIAGILHERRVAHAREQKLRPPPREDSWFIVRLATAATLGDALSTEAFGATEAERRSADLRFRRWFGRLLHEHIERS